MSIIKKLLGGPGYFMDAADKPAESAGSTAAKATPVAPPPVVESPVVPEPPSQLKTVAETATEEVIAEVATTSAKKTRKKKTSAVAADPVPAPASVAVSGGMTDVQALVEGAIAQASAESAQQDAETAAEKTFANNYLLVPTIKGRRKPGPSLTGFMDMAGSMRR